MSIDSDILINPFRTSTYPRQNKSVHWRVDPELFKRFYSPLKTVTDKDYRTVYRIFNTIQDDCRSQEYNLRKEDLLLNVILNCIYAIQIGDSILYRRDRNFYNSLLHAAYSPSLVSYVDTLVEVGYVTSVTGSKPSDRLAPKNRVMSSFRPTQKFYDLFRSPEYFDTIQLIRDSKPLMLFKSEKVQRSFIDKDGRKRTKTDRKRTPLPIKNNVFNVKYQLGDTEYRHKLTISAAEKMVNELNKVNLTHVLSFPKGALITQEDKDVYKYTKHHLTYDRIYTNSMSKGGRYYSHFLQNMSSKARKRILIDGCPVVELDYSAIHAAFVYHSKGLSIPDNDLYTVEGYEEYRGLCKVGLLIMLNASDEKSGRSALWKHVLEDKGSKWIEYADLQKLVDAFIVKHRAISDQFFCGKGLFCQNMDARIATGIAKEFSKQGKAIHIIHDSFLVKEEDEEMLRELMMKFYRKVVKIQGDSVPKITTERAAVTRRITKKRKFISSILKGEHEMLDWDDKSLDIIEGICLSRDSLEEGNRKLLIERREG